MSLSKANNAIFICFDNKCAGYAIACLNSIEKNYPKHPKILAYYDGHDKSMLKFLSRINNLDICEYKEDSSFTKGLSLNKEVNVSKVYFRYNLWTDSFENYDNILHLDVDTIILKPLDILINKQNFFITANHEVWPFVRVFHPDHQNDKKLLSMLHEDGISYPSGMDDMGNAGVFVIPYKYRTRNYYDTLTYLTKKYNKYLQYADQSAISLWCHYFNIKFSHEHQYDFQMPIYRSTKDMVPKYSTRYKNTYKVPGPKSSDIKFLGNIYILHFSSPRKPDKHNFLRWNCMGNLSKPLSKVYEYYRYLNGKILP